MSLGDGQHIIAYDEGPSPENSLIRCPYDLQEGQQVVAVIWELLQDGKRAGSFKWRPGRGGTSECPECVPRGMTGCARGLPVRDSIKEEFVVPRPPRVALRSPHLSGGRGRSSRTQRPEPLLRSGGGGATRGLAA